MDWFACSSQVNQQSIPTISCVDVVVARLVNAVFLFLGTAIVVVIIIGGIRLLTSGGDPKNVETARKTITYGLIGAVIILLVFAILHFLVQLTGINCLLGGLGGCTK